MSFLLDAAGLERILAALPTRRIGVFGDLFLDRYLDLDAALTESSIETGLDAYQVVRVRSYPGAAGTVLNNLVALGVGEIVPIALIGDDGEGHELLQALRALRGVNLQYLALAPDRAFRTPTYTKPMLHGAGAAPRELNRLDIKNRRPLPDLELLTAQRLRSAWAGLDALVVVDQVSEADCGVVTTRMRGLLVELASSTPARFVLADSRAHIGQFQEVCLKPNEAECARAVPGASIEQSALRLAKRCGRPVFCTRGPDGILLADPPTATEVPAVPVRGPIDVVGAGDSTSAGIASAVAAQASLVEAAAFGNLVASITVQQIGVTGTASPEQLRLRLKEWEG